MKHLFITTVAIAAALSASAQTGGASQSASGSRQVITTNENDTREVIDIGYVSNGSIVKIDGRKTVVKRSVDGQRRDTVIDYAGGPVILDGTRETIIIDDLNNPIAIGGFEDPIIVEEPYDYAEDGVYIKNGKEFLFGDSGATPKKARFGVIGGHWAGISFGYSGLISDMGHWGLPEDGAYLDQRANSPSLNINIIGLEILSTRHFAITTGIGLEFNNYRFREPMILRHSKEIGTYPDYSIHNSGGRTDKSKLSTNYINIPLLAEFRFGCKNGYSGKAGYVYGGVIGGWGYNVHSKIKYNNGSGRLHKTKDHNVGTTNFRYGYIVGVGYSHYGIYMQYYPDPIFKEGPRVRQVSIGLSFNWGKVR